MGVVTRKKGCTLLALLMLASTATLSQSLRPFESPQYRVLATVTIGPDFVQSGQSQTLTLLPPFQNHYTNSGQTQAVFDGGLFLGFERTISERFSAQLGVAGYGDTTITSQGDVWQFALPKFADLNHTYQVQHGRVMVSGKFLGMLPQHQAIRPYVSVELGAAFNHANSYQETSLVPGVLPMSPFSNNSQTSFSWGVGLGSDYSINSHMRIGVGYQFADLGSASLGPTLDATTTETLVLSHLYTNQLRFQLTYLV